MKGHSSGQSSRLPSLPIFNQPEYLSICSCLTPFRCVTNLSSWEWRTKTQLSRFFHRHWVSDHASIPGILHKPVHLLYQPCLLSTFNQSGHLTSGRSRPGAERLRFRFRLFGLTAFLNKTPSRNYQTLYTVHCLKTFSKSTVNLSLMKELFWPFQTRRSFFQPVIPPDHQECPNFRTNHFRLVRYLAKVVRGDSLLVAAVITPPFSLEHKKKQF